MAATGTGTVVDIFFFLIELKFFFNFQIYFNNMGCIRIRNKSFRIRNKSGSGKSGSMRKTPKNWKYKEKTLLNHI